MGGETVDFRHMMATLNALRVQTDGNWWQNLVALVGESVIDDLAGWAGDLQQLIIEAIEKTGGSTNSTTFYTKCSELLGSSNSTFTMADLRADLDAIYFADQGNARYDTVAIAYYKGSNHSNRYVYFADGRSKAQFKSDAQKYTRNLLPNG
ncbi:MAG: hypothetical protein LBC83_01500 [Oscillospiraceae bacterium]|nr:hypothetical protein [Oscillospiraceae bacterium]